MAKRIKERIAKEKEAIKFRKNNVRYMEEVMRNKAESMKLYLILKTKHEINQEIRKAEQP